MKKNGIYGSILRIERIQDGSIVSYKDTDVKNKTEYKYEVGFGSR